MKATATKNETELAIELSGLTKRFGSTLAVDDLSLSLKKGSTFGLIGPNGSGKSTTIKMLMGILRPTAGTVRVLGRDVDEEAVEIRHRVGYVPELHFMDRWMRVTEVIGYCRSAFANWNDETCREMLERFELDPKKKVKHLSKGMVVKLSLVLAVSHEPEMLVLDEPMAGMASVGCLRRSFRPPRTRASSGFARSFSSRWAWRPSRPTWVSRLTISIARRHTSFSLGGLL